MFTKADIVRMINDTTPSKSRDNLSRGDIASMRAVCALFRRQTADERRDAATRHDNKRGFSQAHAKIGSSLAEWMSNGRNDGILRRPVGGKISQWIAVGVKPNGKTKWRRNQSKFVGRDRLDICREIAATYAGQLADEANRNR